MKFFLKSFLVVAILLVLFLVSQFTLYQYEDGIFVADGYTDPPVSKTIYYRGRPLSEAVVSTRRVGSIDSSGKRSYHRKAFMSWAEKWAYWNALRKFSTLEKCLLPEGQKTMDLSKFSWGSMRTNTQVEVCLFHLSAKLKSQQEIMLWAERQGFSTRLSQGSRGSGILAVWQRTGNTIDSPYPFFSRQTLIGQYGLAALILGRSGLPEWRISMDKKQQAFSIRIRNSPNK